MGPEPVTGLACSVMAEPGLKISPAVGLVMDTMGAAPGVPPPPPVEVGLGLGDGDGVVVGVGDEVGVVEGEGLGEPVPPPLQAVPLSVNAVGAALVPL